MKVLVVDGLQALQEQFLQGKRIRVKFVTCGRRNCRCALGERHGPYYYLRKRMGNRYKDVYVKTQEKPPSLKYEPVGNSVLLDVKNVQEIPDFLKDYPTFMIQEKILRRSRGSV